MKELVALYDNALIYYPNVFFPVLFFLAVLIAVIGSLKIIDLIKGIKSAIEEIRKSLYNKKKKVSFVSITKLGFKKKKITFILLIKIYAFIKICLGQINALFVRVELQSKKIIEKVAREILIDN